MMTGVTQVQSKIDLFGKGMVEQAKTAVARTCKDIEDYSKLNAPWTDRTGNARNSIIASDSVVDGNRVYGVVAIGVEYGKFLELCNGGKYRIIKPAVEVLGYRVLQYLTLGSLG